MRKLLLTILAAAALIGLSAPALAKMLPTEVYVPDFGREMHMYWEIWGPIPYEKEPSITWGKGKMDCHLQYNDSITISTYWRGGQSVKIPQGPWNYVIIEAYEERGRSKILKWRWEWE